MKIVSAAVFAFGALALSPAVAADLFGTSPPLSFPASSGPGTEIGSNWYLRGDVGASVDTAGTFNVSSINAANSQPPGDASTPWDTTIGPSKTNIDPTFDLAVGFKMNNYVRLEAEYGFTYGRTTNSTTPNIWCPYTLNGLTTQGATPVLLGYAYNPTDTCDGVLNVSSHNNTFLANAYFDLGNYWGVTPYIGGGAGLNVNTISGSLNYLETANGSNYAANLTPTGGYPLLWVDKTTGATLSPQPNVSFTQQNWNRKIASTKYSLAWDLSAGIGILLTPAATLDLSYRYMNLGSRNSIVNAATGAVVQQVNTSQQFRIGVRYMAD